MKIACIYWQMVGQIGGIATHLNRLRDAAIKQGDTFDILLSGPRKSKKPGLYPERKWVRGKDTCIWTCGEAPHHPDNVEDTVKWLEENYDAVVFGYFCPNKTKAYPEPLFLDICNVNLPIVAYVMDGYWETYKEWAEKTMEHVDGIICPLESYAIPVKRYGKPVLISPFPFSPRIGKTSQKAEKPLIVWPNQWKAIKGIKPFLKIIPDLQHSVDVELYSCAVDYYQMRTGDTYLDAIDEDRFKGFNGRGRATYFGNVDIPIMMEALQRAWFTVNLQGMKSRKETYQKGSYNNTEVEALWYGACPILHSSTLKTDLPKDVYISVDSEKEIPDAVKIASKGFALSERRRDEAREFIREKHLASKVYSQLRDFF